MSELLRKQLKFAEMVARLILEAVDMGYQCKLGEVYRPPETAQLMLEKGKSKAGAKSLHTKNLAIDLLLFKDGVYLTKSEDYEPLGKWWESQGGAWGGRFSDGNHFSLEHGGVK